MEEASAVGPETDNVIPEKVTPLPSDKAPRFEVVAPVTASVPATDSAAPVTVQLVSKSEPPLLTDRVPVPEMAPVHVRTPPEAMLVVPPLASDSVPATELAAALKVLVPLPSVSLPPEAIVKAPEVVKEPVVAEIEPAAATLQTPELAVASEAIEPVPETVMVPFAVSEPLPANVPPMVPDERVSVVVPPATESVPEFESAPASELEAPIESVPVEQVLTLAPLATDSAPVRLVEPTQKANEPLATDSEPARVAERMELAPLVTTVPPEVDSVPVTVNGEALVVPPVSDSVAPARTESTPEVVTPFEMVVVAEATETVPDGAEMLLALPPCSTAVAEPEAVMAKVPERPEGKVAIEGELMVTVPEPASVGSVSELATVSAPLMVNSGLEV